LLASSDGVVGARERSRMCDQAPKMARIPVMRGPGTRTCRTDFIGWPMYRKLIPHGLGLWGAYLMMPMIMIAGLAVAGPRARWNIRSVSRADQRHSHRRTHD
jgi:hypothetical protein